MPSTLYPKITNHIKEVLESLHRQTDDLIATTREDVDIGLIPIVGTVKLHGTHADILIYFNNNIVLQSRNRLDISESKDNHEFVKVMSKKCPTLLKLRDQFYARWKELNPAGELDKDVPITIAGEWIGEDIQKGVALTRLSKRLVIISAKINGKWVEDEKYADIHAEEEGIYNISRGGFFHAILDVNDTDKSTKELEKLAENVAAECPFAESFDITGGGEGIVWKLQPYIDDERLWFKTKGGKFKPTFAPALKKPKLSEDILAARKLAAKTFAEAWCSELRLEQGVDILREKHIPQDIQGLGHFLKWVSNDIMIEEKIFIEEQSVDERLLKTEIVNIAKPWYLAQCKNVKA